MAVLYDYRTKRTSALSFYVYDNRKTYSIGPKTNYIFRYDTLKDAIDKFNEFPKDWVTAIGVSLDDLHEVDLVQRINGTPTKINDFYNIRIFNSHPAVHGAIKELEETLLTNVLEVSLTEKQERQPEKDVKVAIFHNNEEDMASYNEELKYWSNALGELHHYGEYDITEEELPEELKYALENLFDKSGGSLCYLAETKNGYGVALLNEYDKTTAENAGDITMEELFETLKKDAAEMSKCEELKKVQIIAAEKTGVDNSHELIVVLPANISVEEFEKAVSVIDGLAYKNAEKSTNDQPVFDPKSFNAFRDNAAKEIAADKDM